MYLHAPTKSVVLKAADPFLIRSLLPGHSRLINHPDCNVTVRHTLETTRLLRNIGLDVPSPIISQYDWPGKYTPFAHQRVMADFLTTITKGFNLSEMGVGKTYAALWAADYLMAVGAIKRVAIITPMSTMDTVWKQDIFDLLMHRTCGIAHGTMKRRLEVLNTDLDFYVVNHDGIALPDVARLVRKRKDIDLIIVDEVSMFRNSKIDKYKMLQWVMERKRRLWCITGTPCPNAPTDAWALARLVDPARVPKWFGSFQRKTMVAVSEHKWVPRAGASEMAYDAMKPAVRFLKKDCLTLPPVVVENRQTSLTAEQRTKFKEMKNEMAMSAGVGTIDAVNAADKINKLRQILCGSVKDAASGTYILLDHGPRLRDLEAAIDEANAKVIVIVPFKGIIQALAKELTQDGYTVGVLNGDVSPRVRDHTIGQFKHEANPTVLLCHPKVMSHGLNLTVADTTIFYAPIYSNDEYEQVVERFNRAGQTRKMTILRLAADPLEWEIYRMVDNKRLTQKSILDLYATITH